MWRYLSHRHMVNSTCQLTCVNNVSDAWSDLLLDVSVESIFYERNIYEDFLTNEVFPFYHELSLYRKLTVCLKPKCSPKAKYKVHLCQSTFLEQQNLENMTFSKYMERAYQDDLKAVVS